MRTTGGEYDDGLDRIVAVEGDWERTYEFELCEDCQCWFGETADLSSGGDRLLSFPDQCSCPDREWESDFLWPLLTGPPLRLADRPSA